MNINIKNQYKTINKLINDLKKSITINQMLLDKENNILTAFISSKHFIYKINVQKSEKVSCKQICNVKFIHGTPHGSFNIIFKNDSLWQANNIIKGRVFDFLQSIYPIKINLANYNNINRGEASQLLTPEHAIEIDKLRFYFQKGKISKYEFDDFNPSYSKSGK